jgi:hypothetical protein
VEEQHDSLETFDAAVQTWKKAQVVREDPAKMVGPAAEMIQVLAADIGKYRQRLFKCLFDDEQLVVAYALLVLKWADDPMLKELPEQLLNRREKITVRSGSFSEKMELCAFARMLTKQACG